MRRTYLKKTWPVILVFLLGASPLWGQEGPESGGPPGQDVPGAIGTTEVCPCTFGPVIADTAVPLEKGKFAIQPLGVLRFTGGVFSRNWRRVSAGGDFVSFELPVKFTYGLANNWEVYAIAAYKHNWARHVNEPGPNGERQADFGGLRDTNLTLKYRLVEEKDWWPTVTGLFSVDFPTGHYFRLNPGRLATDALGSGAYAFTLGLNLSKWLQPFILYGNLWYSMSTNSKLKVEREDLGTATESVFSRDVLYFRLAAEYPLGGKGPWVALLEFYSEWALGRVIGPKANIPAYALVGTFPGLEYVYSDKLAFAAGVAIELAGKNAAFEYTPILSMVYIF